MKVLIPTILFDGSTVGYKRHLLLVQSIISTTYRISFQSMCVPCLRYI